MINEEEDQEDKQAIRRKEESLWLLVSSQRFCANNKHGLDYMYIHLDCDPLEKR